MNQEQCYNSEKLAISIEDYRRICTDYKSLDAEITEKLEYLMALCRNVIRGEMEIYVKREKAK